MKISYVVSTFFIYRRTKGEKYFLNVYKRLLVERTEMLLVAQI